uniref:NADH dehydrogenase subunit 2 n=1 Tax=Oesophagostomum dentatum TaxID=61180 RepID=D3J862_OESDE|nr:NADH dehydrogenase subunit 2 [Oesophagostomum dentatum]ACX85161.1 NADH dehydrogenase subunit 2 [Oesophagostomum dentatum]BAV82775.1 NADH dehydrogenase subunit 2 [Oesophagostomum dentatum]CAQ56155.1 NADH dehydrogenase subunit 2 [Oesophagostomum dentatum]
MYVFMMIFVIFLSLLAMLVNNILVWWSIFLLMTLVFVMLNKTVNSYSSLFNYFVMQESLGLLFLMFSFGYFQLLIVMFKIGMAPFHFWIFSVTNSVFGFNLMWFLTFQKLPFLLIFLQMMLGNLVYLLMIGLFFCLFQMLLMKTYKNLLILSSTESFNWITLGFLMSFLNILFIFIYYFVLMVLVIPKFEFFNVSNFVGWETMLIFMNLPFSVNFFVKIFSLSEILKVHSFNFLLLLFMMFFSVLSLSFWMVNLSTKFNMIFKYNKGLFLFFMPLTLMILI